MRFVPITSRSWTVGWMRITSGPASATRSASTASRRPAAWRIANASRSPSVRGAVACRDDDRAEADDEVQVGPREQVEVRRRVHAAVDVASRPDAHRPVEAGDRAGRGDRVREVACPARRRGRTARGRPSHSRPRRPRSSDAAPTRPRRWCARSPGSAPSRSGRPAPRRPAARPGSGDRAGPGSRARAATSPGRAPGAANAGGSSPLPSGLPAGRARRCRPAGRRAARRRSGRPSARAGRRTRAERRPSSPPTSPRCARRCRDPSRSRRRSRQALRPARRRRARRPHRGQTDTGCALRGTNRRYPAPLAPHIRVASPVRYVVWPRGGAAVARPGARPRHPTVFVAAWVELTQLAKVARDEYPSLAWTSLDSSSPHSPSATDSRPRHAPAIELHPRVRSPCVTTVIFRSLDGTSRAADSNTSAEPSSVPRLKLVDGWRGAGSVRRSWSR